MTLRFAAPETSALPVQVVSTQDLMSWRTSLSSSHDAWVTASGFSGAIGEYVLLPGQDGTPVQAALGYGSAQTRKRGRFALAAAAARLPKGVYHIENFPTERAEEEALGWLLTGYAFDRYRAQSRGHAELVAPQGMDSTRIESMAAAEALTRDLINTPASDMGPTALETAAHALAQEFGATMKVTRGDDLLAENYPMIHAVGRAAADAPRLIEMTWGHDGPLLSLVGKGVCFDTGGLNLKPGASMGLMKKDMGGSANVLGLARMIMAADWPIRLQVLIPAVENAVSGNSFRPQDILTSRKGLTVEINNTDAEGRLVLADALARADEGKPDLILSMATLTGAARVAVGPDIAPFFTDHRDLAASLMSAGEAMADPVWQLPFHAPYEARIEPGIADLDNAPSGGMAGAITAALFLRRFVEHAPYAHFDVYGWQPTPAPARTKGGLGQGARALFQAVPSVLGI
jgi:leucyl aminopeptidase